jgi:hypothetical protein
VSYEKGQYNMNIKIGSKKAGSYIDFIKYNPSETFEILSKGSNNSKAVYVAAVMVEKGYGIIDFNIDPEDIGKKEPLAVLKIVMRANDGSKDNNKRPTVN